MKNNTDKLTRNGHVEISKTLLIDLGKAEWEQYCGRPKEQSVIDYQCDDTWGKLKQNITNEQFYVALTGGLYESVKKMYVRRIAECKTEMNLCNNMNSDFAEMKQCRDMLLGQYAFRNQSYKEIDRFCEQYEAIKLS